MTFEIGNNLAVCDEDTVRDAEAFRNAGDVRNANMAAAGIDIKAVFVGTTTIVGM
ncbi:MAG: hypothetical protein HQ472_02775 [Ignavibacteria bacterium]|nr:hypothetical protein [Ignavibacteria bacterium]